MNTKPTIGPFTRIAALMPESHLDSPITDPEAEVYIVECVRDEMRDKLSLLRRCGVDRVMVDVDQTAFAVVSEVLSRVGPWVLARPPRERHGQGPYWLSSLKKGPAPARAARADTDRGCAESAEVTNCP